MGHQNPDLVTVKPNLLNGELALTLTLSPTVVTFRNGGPRPKEV